MTRPPAATSDEGSTTISGDLRPGIILTVTGIVVLAHFVLWRRRGLRGRLPPTVEVVIGTVLLVVGIPVFLVGALG